MLLRPGCRPYPSLSLALASLILSAAPLVAQPSSPYGLNVHAPQRQDLVFLFDKVKDAGIGWVRIDFVWALIEREPGVSRWRAYDNIVRIARQHDLEILALIAYTPSWATDGPEIAGVPRDFGDWTDFCREAARRYRRDIFHWEIWNEPNLPAFWVGSRGDYIDGILRDGAAAIRSGNPKAEVGGPALAHFVGKGRDWYSWLADILNAAADDLDFLTHHVYDLDGPDGVTTRLEGPSLYGSEPGRWGEDEPALREVLDVLGWTRPLWVTETGWVSTRLDEKLQARHYQGFLDTWLVGDPQRSWLDKVFFYEIRDAEDPRIEKYGILRFNGQEKPAYWTYADFISAHPPLVVEPLPDVPPPGDGPGGTPRNEPVPPDTPAATDPGPGPQRPPERHGNRP